MKAGQKKTKNGLSVIIREATADDAEELVEFVELISGESNFLSMGPGEFGVSVEEERKILEARRESKDQVYMVACIDGAIVGSLGFTAGRRPRTRHCGSLGISVKKAFWGVGVGTLLMDALFDWSAAQGEIRKINLYVRTDNLRAIRLYEKKGFKIEGTVSKEVCIDGSYYDCHVMGIFWGEAVPQQ
jgi:RimJ/RimL family protein N-acetyltransferase